MLQHEPDDLEGSQGTKTLLFYIKTHRAEEAREAVQQEKSREDHPTSAPCQRDWVGSSPDLLGVDDDPELRVRRGKFTTTRN